MSKISSINLHKSFLRFTIPAMLAGIFSQAFSIIDTVMAGKILGENGIAAIGSTAQIVTLLSCAFSGYAVGVSVYISTLLGGKNYKKAKENILTSYIFIGIITVLTGILLAVFSGKIVELFRVDNAVKKDAQIYFSLYMLGFVLIAFNSLGNFFMQSFNNTRFGLLISLISSVLHIVCSYFLVKILDMGVGGFAIAYLLSALLSDICYILKLRSYIKKFNIAGKFKMQMKSVITSLTYALPTLCQQMVMYASDVMTSPLVNSLGASATSAFSVASRINTFCSQSYYSSSKALSNYAARCIGAGKADGLREGVRVNFIQSVVLLLPFIVLSHFFAESICSVFFPKGFSGQGITLSVLFVKSYMPFVFFNIINNLFHSFFRGIKAMGLLNIITAVGSVSRYLLTLLLVGNYEMNGVYSAWVLSWIIEAVLCIFIYFSKKWNGAVLRQLNKG